MRIMSVLNIVKHTKMAGNHKHISILTLNVMSSTPQLKDIDSQSGLKNNIQPYVVHKILNIQAKMFTD